MQTQNNTKYIWILMCAVIFSFVSSKITFALECSKPIMAVDPQVDWPASPLGGYELNKDSTIANLVAYFFGWGVGLGGLAVFIALIIAGVQYITSVANPAKITEAKNRIKSSAIGLALLLSSWAIFNLINPNLTKMESNFNVAFTKIVSESCATASDCCDLNKPDCIPKNWRCCRSNDEYCIETGNKQDPKGTLGIGQKCLISDQCESGLCECNYGIDPESYEKTGWGNVCMPNPTICIENPDAKELGCDKVVFYNQTNFEGNEVELKDINGNINGGWAWFGSFRPKSYQAFYKEKDKDGNETLLPCGYLACGCQINRCLDAGDAGGSNCINDTADNESGNFTEYVYSESNFETISGVRIKDPTKATGVSEDENKSWWGNLYNKIIGE